MNYNKTEIVENLNGLDIETAYALLNEYLEDVKDYDYMLMSMDDFDDLMGTSVEANGALWLTQKHFTEISIRATTSMPLTATATLFRLINGTTLKKPIATLTVSRTG